MVINKDPLQNLLTQISIWGHLGSQGSKSHFHCQSSYNYVDHVTYVHDTFTKVTVLNFDLVRSIGVAGIKKVISTKNDITCPCYIA